MLRTPRDKLKLIGKFEKIENWQVSIFVLIVILWSLLVIPAISIRGLHYEEDTVVALARGAAGEGHWLVPYFYGTRFVERPVLMSWLIAGLATVFGGMNQWIIRIPTVLSLLLGGVLVARLVRVHASALAALFGALCFFLCPSILQKLVTAEPDVMVAALQFLAFVIWWGGHRKNQPSTLRWAIVGLILALASLPKGPQPLAYFFIGVAAFLALDRKWRELAGLTLAGLISGGAVAAWYVAVYQPGDLNLWVAHSRIGVAPGLTRYVAETVHFVVQLALELMPATLLVVPFYWSMRKRLRAQASADPSAQLALALLLYASLVSLVLAFWPAGSNTRYAIPAVPAVAAAAGLAFDRLRSEAPRLVNVSLAGLAGLAAYQITVGWILMPNFPALFAKSRITGSIMAAEIEASPATLYAVAGPADASPLGYIPSTVRRIDFAQLADVQTPAWAVVTRAQLDQLRRARPEIRAGVRLIMSYYDGALLVFLEPREQPDE
jgi:4-amino-4-deoxy-L-arabinose transferase-like glycosyltransferase